MHGRETLADEGSEVKGSQVKQCPPESAALAVYRKKQEDHAAGGFSFD
jgi:hypothetical protein